MDKQVTIDSEVSRVSRHLMETLLKIRKWPMYPDSENPFISEYDTAEILRQAFTRVSVQYAERFNP